MYAEIPITHLARKDSEEHLPAGYSACEGVGAWDFTLNSHTIPLLQPKKVTGFLLFLSYFSSGWVCSLNG